MNSRLLSLIFKLGYYVSLADPATKADDICFETANTRGNLFGNCGRNGAGFIKCTVA